MRDHGKGGRNSKRKSTRKAIPTLHSPRFRQETRKFRPRVKITLLSLHQEIGQGGDGAGIRRKEKGRQVSQHLKALETKGMPQMTERKEREEPPQKKREGGAVIWSAGEGLGLAGFGTGSRGADGSCQERHVPPPRKKKKRFYKEKRRRGGGRWTQLPKGPRGEQTQFRNKRLCRGKGKKRVSEEVDGAGGSNFDRQGAGKRSQGGKRDGAVTGWTGEKTRKEGKMMSLKRVGLNNGFRKTLRYIHGQTAERRPKGEKGEGFEKHIKREQGGRGVTSQPKRRPGKEG